MPKREDDDRREFLKACGRFAAVTPPAITLLLSTSLTSAAIAHSGGGRLGGSSGSRGTGSEHSFFSDDREMGMSGGGAGGGKVGTGEAGGTTGGSPADAGVASGSSPSPGTTVHTTTSTTPSQTFATPNKSTDYFNPGEPAANSAFPNNDQRSVAHPAGSSTGVAAVQTNPTTLNAASSQSSIAPGSGAGIAPTQTHRKKAGAGG